MHIAHYIAMYVCIYMYISHLYLYMHAYVYTATVRGGLGLLLRIHARVRHPAPGGAHRAPAPAVRRVWLRIASLPLDIAYVHAYLPTYLPTYLAHQTAKVCGEGLRRFGPLFEYDALLGNSASWGFKRWGLTNIYIGTNGNIF